MVVLTSTPAAYAQEGELDNNTRLALANFVAEMVECSVYYAINGQLQDGFGNQWKMGKDYQKLSENMGLAAFALAKTIKMKTETLTAMAESDAREMGQSIDQDAINIRILSNKYGIFCKNLVENPEERIRYWVEKETM
jgi:hypothetical protein